MNLPSISIKKILYATDLSENAAHAFAYAAHLAALCNAGMTILHVIEEYAEETFITNMIGANTWNEIKSRHVTEAWDKLNDIKKQRPAIAEALHAFSENVKNGAGSHEFATDDILVKPGHPTEVIQQTATEQNCDLIVMGTQGHTTLTEILIGSTAEWMIKHAPMPVLVIPLHQ